MAGSTTRATRSCRPGSCSTASSTAIAFPRGLLLGVGDEGLLVLGSHGVPVDTRTAVATDPVVERAWKGRVPVALRRLAARLGPGARSAAAARPPGHPRPMVADGRPLGVLVLEYRNGRLPGVERRVMGVVAQVAAMTALNLRNAVLLRRVQDLAERDALTGAANRRSFTASLERVVASRRAGDGRTSAVLFIDLDDFKIVNDTLGHAIGDELLVAVTRRIGSLVRDGDVLARLGGDEFAILTEDLADLRRARAMAERLVRELRAPYLLGGHPVSISASIGIAGAHDAVDGAADLVRNADVAMYMAKAGGKAGFAIFDPGMHHAIRERHELAIELQQAVELDQLELRYQPIVDLRSGALSGVEALVRWRHPERGLIAPGQFIEIAEEHGSILPIGRWVLREACRQAAEWAAHGDDPARHVRRGQRVRPRGAGVGLRGRRPRGPVRPRRGGDRARHRDHGDRAAPCHAVDDRHAPGPARPRCPGRHRRLRHRLLLPQPPPPVPGRRAQDRPRVHAGGRRRGRRADLGAGRGDRGDGPLARDRDGRGGHRDRGAGRLDALARLHLRPGLLLRPAAAPCRPARGRHARRSCRSRRRPLPRRRPPRSARAGAGEATGRRCGHHGAGAA